jgi:hypothetical protein
MIAPEAAKMTSGASATNSAAYMRKQSASPTPQRALAVSGRPTECRLMAEADITSKKGGFSFCEGFRMPAAPERSRALRRPAYENLQGRKPRFGHVGRPSG